MTGIQIVLIVLLFMILVYTIVRLRNRKMEILLLSALVLSGFVLVLFPDLTIVLAHKLGVGRGTDLVFYISTLLFWFVILKLYTRIRKLEQLLTQVLRKETLKEESEKLRQP
ncbi:MAG TPA: DUF2304 domain-containing protein [Flavisolibacter sp.]|jgi:hypothetical protein|nr:DUF2304 domain-containing protein [Flavisolibacter sp.]